MDDKNQEKQNLERIYENGSASTVFHRNEKYCTGKFANMIAFISINDVMDYKYIIRASNSLDIAQSYAGDGMEIIKEYSSIEELVNDGWRLD